LFTNNETETSTWHKQSKHCYAKTYMESLANPTLRSVIRPSQDCGLKTVCSSITTPVMKGIQVLPLRPMGLPKSSPSSSLPCGAKLWHCTASASSIGDSVPLERNP